MLACRLRSSLILQAKMFKISLSRAGICRAASQTLLTKMLYNVSGVTNEIMANDTTLMIRLEFTPCYADC